MGNRGQIQGKWDLFIDGAKFDFSDKWRVLYVKVR